MERVLSASVLRMLVFSGPEGWAGWGRERCRQGSGRGGGWGLKIFVATIPEKVYLCRLIYGPIRNNNNLNI